MRDNSKVEVVGKNIHPSIPVFFKQRMEQHSIAGAITRADTDNWIIYEIHRPKYGDTVRVYLTDAYLFTEFDLDEMRSELGKNDFVLVARPEAGYTPQSRESGRQTQLGVGKLGDFMGALNKRNMWEYLTKEEREEQAKLNGN